MKNPSSHSPFTSDFSAGSFVQTAHVVIEADADPTLPGRVMGRFAERGSLPLEFRSRLCADVLHIEVRFEADLDAARKLTKRLLNIPSVRSAELSFALAAVNRRAA